MHHKNTFQVKIIDDYYDFITKRPYKSYDNIILSNINFVIYY